MSKLHFYSHLVEIESVIKELESMELSSDEKMHLASLIDANLHHSILDVILSELSPEDKSIFLHHLAEGAHDNIWKFLSLKIDGIESKIIKTSEELKQELHKDIKEAKTKVKQQEARLQ